MVRKTNPATSARRRERREKRPRGANLLGMSFALRMKASPPPPESQETDDERNARQAAERIAEELSRFRAPRPGGPFSIHLKAEEQLWRVLNRPKCGLDTVPVEDLEAALREDLSLSLAPSIVMRIYLLRGLLEQGGVGGECPPRWTAEQWKRFSDPATIADELGRLADAIALRPLKSGRSGRPRAPHALTKRWDGLSNLKKRLVSLLEEAYWLARKQGAIVPGSAPEFRRLYEWVKDFLAGDRIASVPDLAAADPRLGALRLAKRIEALAVHGYSAQRIPVFAAHWATELRTGIIGSPLSETKGHRLKRGK